MKENWTNEMWHRDMRYITFSNGDVVEVLLDRDKKIIWAYLQGTNLVWNFVVGSFKFNFMGYNLDGFGLELCVGN